MNITNEPRHRMSIWKKYFADILTEPQAKHAFEYKPVYEDEPIPSDEKIKEIVAKYEDIEFQPIKTDKEIKRETKEALRELNEYNKSGLGMVGEHRRISE